MRPILPLSVVVPAFNNSHLTARVLEDIARTTDTECEVILVDDGSTDDTAAVVQRHPNVTYIKHEQNRGVSPAWNTGIRAAKGEFVAVLNNDLQIADEHWMSKMLATVQGKKTIGGIELVDFNRASEYNGKIMPYLNGWAYIFPRRIFNEIGLFEEEFAPASFEDLEFCTRAQYAGYSLEVDPSIRIQHAYSQTVSKFLAGDMPRLNERNRKIWLDRMGQLDRQRLRIVFDCPGNMEGGWGIYDLEKRGIGGAETAISLLTRELASRGHEVLLFNDIDHSESDLGVTHHPRKLLPTVTGGECDIFITFRSPSEHLPTIQAKRKIFWSCDQQTGGDWKREIFPHVDTVVCISDFHAEYMSERYGVPREAIVVIGCPVRSWDYEPHPDKDPNQFIFCSVPHRGLQFMPMVMREIRKELPEARLVITSDYRLWGAPDARNDEFKPMFHAPLDDFRGKVDRTELIRLQATSMMQLYSCTYEECFCIAAAECMSAGATPITTDVGAVKQTVGNGGIIVGPPLDDFAQRIAQQALALHNNPEVTRQSIEASWRHSVVNVGSLWEELMYMGLEVGRTPNGIPTDIGWRTVLPTGDILSSRPSN